MGGVGSGGHNRLSDAEKARRGTLRSTSTEETHAANTAAKVVTGPWLDKIPLPTMPMGEVGQKKYDELTRQLFDQNKLTVVTQLHAETAATQYEKIHALRTAGKYPSASDVTQLNRALDALKIAENAPTLPNPDRVNKFARCGFSNRADPSVRLRTSAAARSRK